MWDLALTRNTVQDGEAGTPAALRLWLDIPRIQFLPSPGHGEVTGELQIVSLGKWQAGNGRALGGCSLVPAGISACREQDQD